MTRLLIMTFLTFGVSVAQSAEKPSPPLAQPVAMMSSRIANFGCVRTAASRGSDSILDAKKITVQGDANNLSLDQKSLITGLLTRINELGGGDLISGTTVTIHEGGRKGKHECASFTSSATSVELTNDCAEVRGEKTVAHLAHEFGHIHGIRETHYADYEKVVPRCLVTLYAGAPGVWHSRHEEYAEVFATFLLAPETLKARCPLAYTYLATNVFKKPSTSDCPLTDDLKAEYALETTEKSCPLRDSLIGQVSDVKDLLPAINAMREPAGHH